LSCLASVRADRAFFPGSPSSVSYQASRGLTPYISAKPMVTLDKKKAPFYWGADKSKFDCF